MRTVSTYPIVGAMAALEELIGPDRQWTAINVTQDFFVRNILTPGRSELSTLAAIKGLTLDQVASKTADEINRFLAEHGFEIQLEKFGPDEVGAAAAMQVALSWAVAGKRTSILTPGQERFTAFELEGDSVSFLRPERHAELIARLATKNPQLSVYVTPYEESTLPERDFALVGLTRSLLRGAQPDWRHEGVIVPMVDLSQEVDIGWLLGMKSPPWFISQAKQQTVLKWNELGFLTKSAAAVGASKGGLGMPFTINRPFLAWIEYAGLSQPLLIAHVTEEDWKDPGTITELGEEESDLPSQPPSKPSGRIWPKRYR